VQTQIQLTFRSIAHSDALAIHLQQRADKLDQLFDRILWCHVVIELGGHHHRHGDRYVFSINLGLPGHEIVVTRSPATGRDDETAYESADRAFDEAARQLRDWVGRRRGSRHEEVGR
jgi:ribosome-associated translation inhibitor RaiA